MLLLKDSLVELHYDVTTDILSMKWPDLTGLTKSEIMHSLKKVIDTLKFYDIKKFLIDSRGNRIEVPVEDHRQVVHQFGVQLLTTRVEKLARIASNDMVREDRTHKLVEEVNKEITFNMQFQEFDNEQAALAWLKGH
ncbi:hypothetical protein [Rufibacter roseus]|uniref:STAS/SEC14 domain-containing protein n=1 Tax=Rufibacter roseus TaxID=1567108 RepID=A0ABW2DMC5_9BACT|nr:hypothetical protein [Rufibacter roseus]